MRIRGRSLLEEIRYARPTSRLDDIDAARGIAILLVVVGHIGTQRMPHNNEWYFTLMKLIYQFHMPLFMVLTGVTFALSLPVFCSWKEVFRFCASRAKRLLIPYLLVGFAVLLGKTAAAQFVYVDNPPGSFAESVALLFLVPDRSAARFLWFIYVLSIYLVLIPPFFYVIGRRPVILLILGIGLQLSYSYWPPLFMLDRVIEYLPFYAAGMILWTKRASWAPIPQWAYWSAVFVFGAVLLLSTVSFPAPKWLVGTLSVPAIIGIAQRIPDRFRMGFGILGVSSLSIYLFNGIAMGIVKGILFPYLSWDGRNFLLYFPLLILVGVSIPIGIKRLSFRLAPAIGKYF